MAWLDGWKYRKQVTLSRATGAVTNYQMKLLVGESSGATGENVDCGGHCLSTFNDLRFTTLGGTLLDYWVESLSGATPNQLATVWIEFDSIGTGDTTFYMYYGNAGASSYSNGENTFPFFDHFEGTSLNANKWSNDGGTITVGSSILDYLAETSADKMIKGLSLFGINYATRFRAKTAHASATYDEIIGVRAESGGLRLQTGQFSHTVNTKYRNYTVSGSEYGTITGWAANTYALFEIFRENTQATYTINDANAVTLTNYYYNGNVFPYFHIGVTNARLYVDWCLVRQKLATEPAWGSWGSEEKKETEEIEETGETANISAVATGQAYTGYQSESASIGDAVTPYTFKDVQNANISESGTVADVHTPLSEFYRTAAESASTSVTLSSETVITVADTMALADAPEFAFSLTLTDVLFIWDTIVNGWVLSIDESLVLTDSMSIVLGLMISDWITLVDSQANNWNGADTINDSVYLYDLADKYFRIADTVNESVELADTTTYKLTIAVLEYLGFTELATAMRSTAATVNESLALTETQSYAWAELIQEALSVVDAATVIATFVDVVQESVAIADAASLINRLGLSLDESLVFAETVTSKGTLYNAVYDTMKMSVTVELGGEVYECYVLNTPKFMPSMYSGFNFNSYCVFENRAFGANDTGIYELTGTTDAGSTIHTGAILSQTDFGARNEKRFRRAYLGISGTAPVMIFETEEGARQVYNINSEGKTVISHELKSRKWKLSIADFDELDTMKLIPVILSK